MYFAQTGLHGRMLNIAVATMVPAYRLEFRKSQGASRFHEAGAEPSSGEECPGPTALAELAGNHRGQPQAGPNKSNDSL